jgi:acetyl-CoA carboxylase carboxyl transferase subunit beta
MAAIWLTSAHGNQARNAPMDEQTPRPSPSPQQPTAPQRNTIPRNLAVKCGTCREMLLTRDLHLMVCPRCGHHFRMSAPERIASLFDVGTFHEYDADMHTSDPLQFAGYAEKVHEMEDLYHVSDSLIAGMGAIAGIAVSLALLDFRFIGGTLGTVAGEKLVRAVERAIQHTCPFLSISSSGGARMQEGLFSLLQMGKTSAAIATLRQAGQPHIAILTDPCIGGVTASFGSLGDFTIAEPGASMGIAGPRVIEQATYERLPLDAGTAEFALAHGMIDAIVDRRELKQTLGRILSLFHHI